MFNHDFDYLALLGIEPADALGAPGTLADRIKSRKKEWTAQALNPLYQQAARTNLERAREFETLVAEPAALAAYVSHIKQCRAALRGEHEAMVVGLIALAAGGRKELTAAQRELLLKEIKGEGLPPPLLDEVLKGRAVAIVAPRKVDAAPVKLPLQTPALDGVVFAEIQNWLKVLSKGSLYELLDTPSSTPPPRLTSQAQLLFAHWSKVLPKTNTSTAWEKALQSSLTYLKDAESKARYDRSLFNARVQKLVARIDLVLAGSAFATEDATNLVRLGVQEFGFTEALVEQCLAARMAANKVSLVGEPARVVVQVQGQVRCRRCGLWNGPKLGKCRECGSSLHRKCENPACAGGLMPVDAKACPACGLAIVRGVKYRTLLRMADAYLETGSHHAAVSVCQAAEQILAGPAVAERVARAARVRVLTATARTQAAAQAWTACMATLKELATVAPRMVVSGAPTLEKLAQYMAELTEKYRAVSPDVPAVEAARVYLATLKRWSDCEEAFQGLRQLCARLEASRDHRRALVVAGKLLELRPGSADLKVLVSRLEPLAREAEAREVERKAAEREYLAAVRDCRLYAAERALHAIESLPDAGPPPVGADELRRALAGVQSELTELRRAASESAPGEGIVAGYLNVLSRCRDCREALLALQALPIASPAAPEGLEVRREGNRRVLSWRPPAVGKRPTSYVVQRSITRPGSRQVDPPFQTIYEGDALHFTDDEVAHCGVILRYMVLGVARGRVDIDGTTIRSYEVSSPPAAFAGVLIWQEAMNFRSARRDRALELTWFVPAGVRQVMVERWPGGPDEHGLGAVILPTTADGRLVDEGLGDRMVHTYRIRCLYDGPDGDFWTPGICLTDGLAGPAPQAFTDGQAPAGLGVPEDCAHGCP